MRRISRCIVARKNPWYIVRRPNLEVVSGFPHFTKLSSLDERDAFQFGDKKGRDYESLYTEHAVKPGDLIARDGRVVTRKKMGLENPTMKGKPKMWFPKKGSEAAKDLGSLLQKMRKATPEEKEKLKVLFRKTREKWMARDWAGGSKKKNPIGEAVVAGIASGVTMSALKNPYYLTDRSGKVLTHGQYATLEDAQRDAGRIAKKIKQEVHLRYSGDHSGDKGDHLLGGKIHAHRRNPHLVIVGNPPNGIPIPKRLEKAIMKAPAKDRPELLKGVEKYYEFHECFPPRIICKNVDHGKVGLPLVNIGLGRADSVEYRSENKASNKFFAGGKGRYVHKFGDELPKAEKRRAKPLLVTDPTGKTLHYLPSRFKVKDWIHH